jgi:hypothetical protein
MEELIGKGRSGFADSPNRLHCASPHLQIFILEQWGNSRYVLGPDSNLTD